MIFSRNVVDRGKYGKNEQLYDMIKKPAIQPP